MRSYGLQYGDRAKPQSKFVKILPAHNIVYCSKLCAARKKRLAATNNVKAVLVCCELRLVHAYSVLFRIPMGCLARRNRLFANFIAVQTARLREDQWRVVCRTACEKVEIAMYCTLGINVLSVKMERFLLTHIKMFHLGFTFWGISIGPWWCVEKKKKFPRCTKGDECTIM